jgi:hypothetical protein
MENTQNPAAVRAFHPERFGPHAVSREGVFAPAAENYPGGANGPLTKTVA